MRNISIDCGAMYSGFQVLVSIITIRWSLCWYGLFRWFLYTPCEGLPSILDYSQRWSLCVCVCGGGGGFHCTFRRVAFLSCCLRKTWYFLGLIFEESAASLVTTSSVGVLLPLESVVTTTERGWGRFPTTKMQKNKNKNKNKNFYLMSH